MSSVQLDELLNTVEKPSRYLGNELNAVKKDLAAVELKAALAYPDFYEVGMSNTGLHILYYLLNGRPEIAAERVYLPGRDLEKVLEERAIPLFTLENKAEVRAFDVFGIQLPHELAYTNIVKLIRLARIPLWATERGDDDPIVLGGGPGAFGPEVVAPFYDAILLGDAEEALLAICDVLKACKKDRTPRLERLRRLAAIEGLYVPRFFDVTYKPDGTIQGITSSEPSQAVRKAIVPDLETAFYPDKAIVPFADTVHNRLPIEVMRGCTVGCRFCQAGMIYRPLRERSPKRILDLAKCGLSATGFEDVSLLSLDTGDYTLIEPLTKALLDYTVEKKIALSLPSLRAGSLTDETIRDIKRVRKTGFTIAPEAGTQRLRDVINKNVSDEEIFETVERVASQGWSSIKLYFMVGFPTERKEDLDGICDLAIKVRRIARRHQRDFEVTVSVGTLVPKPHTPFQWDAQISTDEANRRMRYLVDRLRPHRLAVKYWDPKNSWLEGVLSRGDRRLAKVVADAEARGCAFDSWTEHFRLDTWREVFRDHGIDADWYLRRRSYDEVLPWDHLDARVGKGFLEADRRKVDRAETQPANVTTFDCRDDLCAGCSACFEGDIRNRLAKYATNPFGDGRRLPLAMTSRIAGGHDFGKKIADAQRVAGLRDQAAKAGEDAAKAVLRRRQRPKNPSERRWHTTPGAPGEVGPAKAFLPEAIAAEAQQGPRAAEEAREREDRHAQLARERSTRPEAGNENFARSQRGEPGFPAVRYRVAYRRVRGLRFLSHLELIRVVYRAVQRAELPVRFSEGYHPKPRITFANPLPVGVESDDEELELNLDVSLEPAEVERRLRAELPVEQGFDLTGVRRVEASEPSLQAERVGAEFRVDLAPLGILPGSLEQARAAFDEAREVWLEQDRNGQKRRVDLKALVSDVSVEGQTIAFAVRTDGASARPDEVVARLLDLAVEKVRAARFRLVRARRGAPAGAAP